jgi:hypothetical protein
MSDKCDSEVFSKGHSVAMLNACMHRAEMWVRAVAWESGQRVDWHYTGGVVNVLYLGDHAKVLAAVEKLLPDLERVIPRSLCECGSCLGNTHRAGRVLRLYHAANAHGPYREGDELPPEVIAVDTH